MGKAISEREFRAAVWGKVGYIYIARNATQVIFVVEGGHTYAAPTTAATTVIVDPAPVWWAGSIDSTGGFAEYFTWGMIPGDAPPYPAKGRPITAEQLDKLKVRLGAKFGG